MNNIMYAKLYKIVDLKEFCRECLEYIKVTDVIKYMYVDLHLIYLIWVQPTKEEVNHMIENDLIATTVTTEQKLGLLIHSKINTS